MTCSLLRGAVVALVVSAALVIHPSTARAEDPVSRLQLSYEAPAGCPSRRDFVALLSPRVQASWIEGADARSFDVRIVREGGAFSGQLVIRQPGTAPNTRAIRAGTCKAVATSLVVFVAIALDPLSEPTSKAEAEPTTETEAAPAASPRRTSEAPVQDAARQRPKPLVPVHVARQPPPSPVVWTWHGGIAAAHMRAPEASRGARVHAELSHADQGDLVAPALRFSWGWSDFSTTPEQAGEVRFRLKSARVEGAARALIGPWFIGAYLGLDVGSLTGIAAELPRFQTVSAPWTAWTGAVRAGVAVTPWLELELGATLLMPFERPRFDLKQPPRVAYAAPAVLFEGTAGLVAVARFR